MKLRILVFDDEPMLGGFLQDLFQERGHEVFIYPHPGLSPLKTPGECPCPPGSLCADIIITDVRMDGMNGIDFIQARLEKGCSHPHVAVMAGNWREGDWERAEALGCKVFDKPFIIADLLAWVEEVERLVPPDRRLADWEQR